MTIIYVAAGLVAGIIIGFLLGRFYTNRALEVGNLEEQVEASQKELSKYKQEMGEHLNATSSLALQMKENYDELLKQVEKASKMMQEDVVNAGSHMPFFSHETSEQLRNVSMDLNDSRKKETPLDEQPKDYSSQPSGLFNEKARTENAQTESAN